MSDHVGRVTIGDGDNLPEHLSEVQRQAVLEIFPAIREQIDKLAKLGMPAVFWAGMAAEESEQGLKVCSYIYGKRTSENPPLDYKYAMMLKEAQKSIGSIEEEEARVMLKRAVKDLGGYREFCKVIKGSVLKAYLSKMGAPDEVGEMIAAALSATSSAGQKEPDAAPAKFKDGQVVTVNRPEDVNEFPEWVPEMDAALGRQMVVESGCWSVTDKVMVYCLRPVATEEHGQWKYNYRESWISPVDVQ